MSRVSPRTRRGCGVVLTTETAWVDRKRDRLQSACKVCQAQYAQVWRDKNRDREQARARGYYSENKARLRVVYDRSRVIRKYGLTPEQIEAMRVAQRGLCAICEVKPATAVDHDHGTGKARALLCLPCNTVLGFMGEDPERLIRAADYLRKHAAQSDLIEVVHTLKQVLCVKG